MKKIEKIFLDILKHGGIGVVLLICLYFISGFDSGDVMGNSMNPYFSNRDSYSSVKRPVTYNRCDVVTFDGSEYDSSVESADFVKRIIGLPNEKVTIVNSKIYINDKIVSENGFLDISVHENDNQSVVLDNDEYFVLGDNRLNSNDSRSFGPVNKRDLSKVISKQGKSECLSAYELIGVVSSANIKDILIISIVALVILITLIFISLYNPELTKKVFKFKYLATIVKILVSTVILWLTLMLGLTILLRLLVLLKLTPAQNNWGNVNEIIEDRETEFKKFDKWL